MTRVAALTNVDGSTVYGFVELKGNANILLAPEDGMTGARLVVWVAARPDNRPRYQMPDGTEVGRRYRPADHEVTIRIIPPWEKPEA